MEYTYFLIEKPDQSYRIRFLSPTPLQIGEQIEVRDALYEVTMIRHICMVDTENCKKTEYKTIHTQAHVRNLKS